MRVIMGASARLSLRSISPAVRNRPVTRRLRYSPIRRSTVKDCLCWSRSCGFVGDQVDALARRQGYLVRPPARRLQANVLVGAQRDPPDARDLDAETQVPSLAEIGGDAQRQAFAAQIGDEIGGSGVGFHRSDGFVAQHLRFSFCFTHKPRSSVATAVATKFFAVRQPLWTSVDKLKSKYLIFTRSQRDGRG